MLSLRRKYLDPDPESQLEKRRIRIRINADQSFTFSHKRSACSGGSVETDEREAFAGPLKKFG